MQKTITPKMDHKNVFAWFFARCNFKINSESFCLVCFSVCHKAMWLVCVLFQLPIYAYGISKKKNEKDQLKEENRTEQMLFFYYPAKYWFHSFWFIIFSSSMSIFCLFHLLLLHNTICSGIVWFQVQGCHISRCSLRITYTSHWNCV